MIIPDDITPQQAILRLAHLRARAAHHAVLQLGLTENRAYGGVTPETMERVEHADALSQAFAQLILEDLAAAIEEPAPPKKPSVIGCVYDVDDDEWPEDLAKGEKR